MGPSDANEVEHQQHVISSETSQTSISSLFDPGTGRNVLAPAVIFEAISSENETPEVFRTWGLILTLNAYLGGGGGPSSEGPRCMGSF